MRNSIPDPPARLSVEARRIWRRIHTDYAITDAAGRLLLASALEALDRMREAQAAIKRDGTYVKDRFGQLKSHPAVLVERDSRTQLLAGLRALRLDDDEPKAIGRPPLLSEVDY